MTLGFQTIFITIILGFLFQYVAQIIFLKYNIVDRVNKRSSHTNIATRSGGISIFSAIFLISLYYYFVGLEIYDFSFIVPLSLLLITGLYDDIYKMDFKLKFIFQIIAAKIIIDSGLIIENLHGFMGIYEIGRVFGHLLTIFIIVSIVNSINFIDGIDGLALSVIIVFISAFEFFSMNQTQLINLSTILIISALPMFYFNFRKNKKVFLGDSGSLFLGGIVSIYVLNILSPSYLIKPEYDINKVFFVISILFYPIIDLVRVFILRIVKGGSPFKADKNHIHHILNIKLKKHWQVSLILTAITILAIILIQIISRK